MKILIIEDSRVDSRALRGLLAKISSDDAIHEAATMAEARAMLEAESFDLILTDLGLPDSQGLDTVKSVRESALGATIVVLTGTQDEDLVGDVLRHGAQDYLDKRELSPNKLKRSLHFALERQKMIADLTRALADVREANETLAGEIDARRKAEDKLLNRERSLLKAKAEMEAIFDSAADAFCVVGKDRRIVRVNDVMADLLGRPKSEIVGGTCGDLLPWCRRGVACHLRDSVIGEETEEYDVDVEIGGETKSLLVTPQAVKDREGTVLSVFYAIKDVSLRKQREREATQSQKLESIGQLAAGIAHEINTPIQYIGDNTSFLQSAFTHMSERLDDFRALAEKGRGYEACGPDCEKALSALDDSKFEFVMEQTPEAIEQSLEGVKKVANIVAAMKEFSHPSGGKKEPMDLHHAIDNTILVARNEWKYVAEIEKSYDAALPPVPVMLDEFCQVILNLVINAAHAIGDKTNNGSGGLGTITIGTSTADGLAEITVSDTGCGIEEANIRKVFDPFFTTKQVGRGSGQGLAIARSVIVDKHEGELLVDSRVGAGTTFTIRLPLVAEPEAGAACEEEETLEDIIC